MCIRDSPKPGVGGRDQGADARLLARPHPSGARDRRDDTSITRTGFTCSKKLGNSVTRNKAKRRLREISRSVLTRLGKSGWDYVLVGRPKATTKRPFSLLEEDLETAVKNIHS